MDTTETARFDPAIPGSYVAGRCRPGNAAFGVTSVVRPPRGPTGGIARTDHTGDGTGGWNLGE